MSLPLLPAHLVLEDGRAFAGYCPGPAADNLTGYCPPAATEVVGEVVFNTAMTGYQEILTDPSYAGQIVVMTSPMIGNYGIAPEDAESRRIFAAGMVVRELSRVASNWRHRQTLPQYLAEYRVPLISDLDTRAVVRHLRTHGAMRGAIGTGSVEELRQRALAAPSMVGCDLASTVSSRKAYPWGEGTPGVERPPQRYHVVAYDFGVKFNILRQLVDAGCRVTVVPAKTPGAEVLAMNPDGVFLSNGPGDPEPVTFAVESIQQILGKVPVFGICLGHQLLSLASGGTTYKLPFGHRGGNHPVQDLSSGKVEITSHNHGFSVHQDSLPKETVEVTHLNLNDKTVEGMRRLDVPAFSVQYHPEAAPGPHDARYLFKRFTDLMDDWRSNAQTR